MQLATMQDLGGCRAVVRRVSNVDRLVKFYEDNPTAAAKFVTKKDYIADPKSDGYRSVHLVYEYQGASQGGVFCGMKIEIQIRSRLQHAWATALETVETFTDEALKSGLGSEAWKRFFVLTSTAIAELEKRPRVPGTPVNRAALSEELRSLCKQLNVPDVFYGLSTGLEMTTEDHVEGAVAYILELDLIKRTTGTFAFVNYESAVQSYMAREKQNFGYPHLQTVLVSVDSLAALKTAYPSYYLDTERFTALVRDLIGQLPPPRVPRISGIPPV